MAKIKIKIPSTGQIYLAETDLKLEPNKEVVAEIDQIIERAIVLCDKDCPKRAEMTVPEEETPKIKILRAMTAEDAAYQNEMIQKGREFMDAARAKAELHGMDIKIVDAELSLDEKKLTFYFSADGRVDFRSLVADMVGTFHKIIRLQQIGPREEARNYGGFGKCGRQLCCAAFLTNLDRVSIDMAAFQELAGGKTSKITGCCGKLMCCLAYEADALQQTKAKMPKIGSNFSSPQGEGKVIGHNVLENKVILETAEGKKIEVLA